MLSRTLDSTWSGQQSETGQVLRDVFGGVYASDKLPVQVDKYPKVCRRTCGLAAKNTQIGVFVNRIDTFAYPITTVLRFRIIKTKIHFAA